MPDETVELRPAFAWDCNRCGRENFANGLIPEITPDQKAELDAAGIQPHELAVAVMAPTNVKCRGCGRTFKGTPWNQFEGDEDTPPE